MVAETLPYRFAFPPKDGRSAWSGGAFRDGAFFSVSPALLLPVFLPLFFLLSPLAVAVFGETV